MGPPRRRLFAALDEAFESIFANRFQHGEARLGLGPGPCAEPDSYRPGRTSLRRDRYRDRAWYCRRLLPLPRCIRRQRRRAAGTASARRHSIGRDSSRSSCAAFVAARAGRARRRSAIAGGFAADPGWRWEKAPWFARPPAQSPAAIHPAANRFPGSRCVFCSDCKIGPDGGRALRKQLDGGILRQRRYRKFLFAINAQAGPAGDQDLERWACFQSFGHHGRRRQDLFEVVEHKQEWSRVLQADRQ